MRPLSFCYDQYGDPADWERDLAMIASIEPRAWIRHDAVWGYIDTGAGHYVWNGNPSLDARIDAVLAHGLRNHLVVPMWAPKSVLAGKADKTQIKTDQALTAFVSFCRALGARYGTKVKSYEPGNEINLRKPFVPDGADPEWQAEVTSAVAPVMPKAWKLITPGLSPATDSGGSLSPVSYMRRYWPALTPAARALVHAAAIHPYGRAADVAQSWSTLGQCKAFHDIVGVPLWGTEQNTDWSDSDVAKAANEPKALDYLRGLGYMERVFVYAMSDPGTDATYHLGLLDGHGQPRPELGAVRAWVALNRKATESADPDDAAA